MMDKNNCIVLSRKEKNLELIRLAGKLALFFGFCSLLLIFIPGMSQYHAILVVVLCFAIALFAYDMGTERVIILDKANGMLEFIEEKPYSVRTSKKYMVSQLEKVKYRKRSQEAGNVIWLIFVFKDGEKRVGFIRHDYVPGSSDFGSAKVEYWL
jgi:hypothetical protein